MNDWLRRHRWEATHGDTKWRIPAILGFIAFVVIVLSGCAVLEQAYEQEPHLGIVCVQPVWSSAAEIQAMCGEGTAACGQIGQHNGQLRLMWAERPASFSDAAKVCALGHELLHNLGATHRQ